MDIVKDTILFEPSDHEIYVKSVIDFSFPEEYAVVGWFRWSGKFGNSKVD
jgi:hypothetical protein